MMLKRLRAALVLVCMTLALGMGALGLPQYAAAEEDVALSLASDKDVYQAGESATFTLTATNNGSGTARDASWIVQLPEGLEPVEGQKLSGTLEDLEPGEVRTVEVAACAVRDVTVPVDEATQDSEGLPTTGDAATWALPLAAALAGGGLIALAVGKRLRGTALSAFLVAGIAAAVALAGATPAYAASSQRTASSSRTVTIDGKDRTIGASLTYTYETADEPDPDEPVDPDEPGTEDPHYNVEFRDDVMVFDEYQVVEENGEKGYLVPAAAVEEQLQKVSAATADAKQESAEAEVQPAMLRAAAAPAGQFSAIDTLDDTIMGADGPMCAFTGNEDEPSGFAGRMLSYEWRPNFDDPMLFLKVTQADDPRDVFEHIDVLDRAREAESYDDLAFADGVSGAVSDDGALEFTLSGFEAGNTESKVVVAFKPIFDFDIDWDMDGFNKCFVEMGVRTDVDGDFTVTGFDREIDLLARPAFVHLGYGFDVAINLVLDVSAEGEVSLHVDLIDTVTATYKDGEFELDSGDDTPAKNDDGWIVNGTVRIGVGPVAWLRVFSIELIDVSGEIGLEGTGGITDRTPYPVVCRDLGLYLYLELGVGDNTNWMEDVGLSIRPWEIWDESNSPWVKRLHWENDELMTSCTFEGEIDPDDPTIDPDDPSDPSDPDDPSEPGENEPTLEGYFVYEVRDVGLGKEAFITGYNGPDPTVLIPKTLGGYDVASVSLTAGEYEKAAVPQAIDVEDGSYIRSFTYRSVADGEAPFVDAAIDLSDCTMLMTVNIDDAYLASLDVSGDTDLVELRCTSSELDEITLDGATSLTTLVVNYNNLKKLDVSTLESLEILVCDSNMIGELDLNGIDALEDLHCADNDMTSLDASGCEALDYIGAERNALTSLDVRGCDSLYTIECHENNLSSLRNDAEMPSVVSVNLSENPLGSFSTAAFPNLGDLQVMFCDLKALDVSESPKLAFLQCMGNDELGELSVSKNTELETLSCGQCALTSLDVSRCTKLETFGCNSNMLTELDVRNNTALKSLDCSWNYLTELDISKNTALVNLTCYYNCIEDTSALDAWNDIEGHNGSIGDQRDPSVIPA